MIKVQIKAAIHMVSAWACENHLVLGQTKVTEKSNEITAIPELLERLDIVGSIITIDAMGCQTKIAQQIVDKGADYVLSLKGNQGNLHDDIKTWFEGQSEQFLNELTELDYGHGRIKQKNQRIKILEEALRLSRNKRFAPSSEKVMVRHACLMKPSRLLMTKHSLSLTKKKAKTGRKPLSKDIPRVPVFINLTKEEKAGAINVFYTKVREELGIIFC